MSKFIDLSTSSGRDTFYNSPEWKAIRRIVLTSNPFCVECLKEGLHTLSSECDHIVDLKDAPERCIDITNLQALCKTHHSQKTFHTHRSFQKKTYTVANKKWNISALSGKKGENKN